ncbi:MAG: type II toxin-antitoxin system prevent-host-death family antitoxin [Alphaproteobacteria bacterium]|nr:type II toxin-antitoxin system prevent-host-death family antitoxin [Alphaproteobacteria bacterium]
MPTVNMLEAKTQLSRLIEAARRGQDVVIARDGTPVARIVPIKRRALTPGLLKGRIRIAKDFDAPLPDDILRRFAGR